jgi:hypothetical protein
MKTLLLLLIAMPCYGKAVTRGNSQMGYQSIISNDDIKKSLLNQLILTYSKKMKNEWGFNLTGSLEIKKNKIKEIHLYYSSRSILDLQLARVLLVEVVSSFIDSVNANALINPYLCQSPFSVTDLEYTIFFRDQKGAFPQSPKISQITMNRGKIAYYTYEKGVFSIQQKESFKKAVEITYKTIKS